MWPERRKPSITITLVILHILTKIFPLDTGQVIEDNHAKVGGDVAPKGYFTDILP